MYLYMIYIYIALLKLGHIGHAYLLSDIAIWYLLSISDIWYPIWNLLASIFLISNILNMVEIGNHIINKKLAIESFLIFCEATMFDSGPKLMNCVVYFVYIKFFITSSFSADRRCLCARFRVLYARGVLIKLRWFSCLWWHLDIQGSHSGYHSQEL